MKETEEEEEAEKETNLSLGVDDDEGKVDAVPLGGGGVVAFVVPRQQVPVGYLHPESKGIQTGKGGKREQEGGEERDVDRWNDRSGGCLLGHQLCEVLLLLLDALLPLHLLPLGLILMWLPSLRWKAYPVDLFFVFGYDV